MGGFPGLFVLDAADGKILGGSKAAPLQPLVTYGASRIISAAWNSTGTLVAGGWLNNSYAWEDAKTHVKPALPKLEPIVLDADGNAQPAPQGSNGTVYGVAFVPGTNTLLLGATQLTAVDARTGAVRWTNGLSGAMAFAFSADNALAAAGGWGKNAGVFNPADGKLIQSANFDSHVGDVALLPNGDLVAAVWGGTRPLFVLHAGTQKPESFFQASYGFQHVLWSPSDHALVAAEEGGNLWLLSSDGKPLAMLSDDAGTTPCRLELCRIATGAKSAAGEPLYAYSLLAARMNRVVQRLGIAAPGK